MSVAVLQEALDFVEALVGGRVEPGEEADAPAPYAAPDDATPFQRLLAERQPSLREFAVLMLGLAPHLDPGLLPRALAARATALGTPPDDLHCHRDEATGLLVATGQTAAAVLAGEDLAGRLALMRLFAPDHWLARDGLLRLEPVAETRPALAGRLVMARDAVERLALGAEIGLAADDGGRGAEPVASALGWDDLVLADEVRERLDEVRAWLDHAATLRAGWGMGRHLRPGFRVLFHGPPGTGKTLTATLLGQATGREVRRVDLSSVVSKYIGETEKNLARLFARAEGRDAILFFDEADALFGKRTAVKDAHDRYANQEVSYLLQRVESHAGLVILATNFRANMDDAFLRRFNAVIGFPMPDAGERRRLWRDALPARGDREALAARMAGFELSGGAIVNAVQHAALRALAAGRDAPTEADALSGVRREIEKEGRVFRDPAAGRPGRDGQEA